MDDLAPALAEPRISADDIEPRRKALRHAGAHNRIESLHPDPQSQPVFEAFVRGGIEYDEILPRLLALRKRKLLAD